MGSDGAYGVLFSKTLDWEAWAQWISQAEVNEGRLRRKEAVAVRAESVPLKLKLKLKYRRPDGEVAAAAGQPKRARTKPNVKVTLGGKRKRRTSDEAASADDGASSGAEASDDAPAAAAAAAVDESIVAGLISMGFDRESGIRASMMTGNASLASAADFLLGGGSSRRGRTTGKSMRVA